MLRIWWRLKGGTDRPDQAAASRHDPTTADATAEMGAGGHTLITRLTDSADPLTRLLLDQAGHGVVVIDPSGTVLRVAGRLRLLVDGVALQPGAAVLGLFAPDDRQGVWDHMRAALIGQVRPPLIVRLGQADAAALPAELSVAPLREADGVAGGLIVRLNDMSEHLRLQAQLAQSQKLQAVGELAAGIAHDFNNLLTAVLGAAELIEARDGLDAGTLDDAALIRGSAERGGALVRQLLAFGRQQTLQAQPVPVNTAITTLTALLSRLLGADIDLQVDLASPGGLIRVDPSQLDQVLINLAINARDAMPQGGTLTLRSGHITLHRPLSGGPERIPAGRYVMIEVHDTGSGIDPALLPRIFDPFVTTKRERGGTGLGLASVHGIIRQSGGFVGVESEPGCGTRMRVYLPRLEEALAMIPPLPTSTGDAPPSVLVLPPAPDTPRRTPAPDASRAASPSAAPTVLLVEDELPIRRLAERALAAAGWAVLSADSAETALVLAQDGPELALLVSDVLMPGMDGPSLAATLRRRWPSLPVLLVSGYADAQTLAGLDDAGMSFLAKPYRMQELTAAASEHR